MQLTSLPPVVLLDILFNWISLQDFVYVDTCFCMTEQRTALLKIVTFCKNCSWPVSFENLNWMLARSIPVSSISGSTSSFEAETMQKYAGRLQSLTLSTMTVALSGVFSRLSALPLLRRVEIISEKEFHEKLAWTEVVTYLSNTSGQVSMVILELFKFDSLNQSCFFGKMMLSFEVCSVLATLKDHVNKLEFWRFMKEPLQLIKGTCLKCLSILEGCNVLSDVWEVVEMSLDTLEKLELGKCQIDDEQHIESLFLIPYFKTRSLAWNAASGKLLVCSEVEELSAVFACTPSLVSLRVRYGDSLLSSEMLNAVAMHCRSVESIVAELQDSFSWELHELDLSALLTLPSFRKICVGSAANMFRLSPSIPPALLSGLREISIGHVREGDFGMFAECRSCEVFRCGVQSSRDDATGNCRLVQAALEVLLKLPVVEHVVVYGFVEYTRSRGLLALLEGQIMDDLLSVVTNILGTNAIRMLDMCALPEEDNTAVGYLQAQLQQFLADHAESLTEIDLDNSVAAYDVCFLQYVLRHCPRIGRISILNGATIHMGISINSLLRAERVSIPGFEWDRETRMLGIGDCAYLCTQSLSELRDCISGFRWTLYEQPGVFAVDRLREPLELLLGSNSIADLTLQWESTERNNDPSIVDSFSRLFARHSNGVRSLRITESCSGGFLLEKFATLGAFPNLEGLTVLLRRDSFFGVQHFVAQHSTLQQFTLRCSKKIMKKLDLKNFKRRGLQTKFITTS